MIARGTLVALLASSAVVAIGLATATAAPDKTSGRFAFRGEVNYVVDGDTINVELDNGRSTRVRLIGIDTPERGECFSRKATAAARRIADGRRVVLKGDGSQATRDRYGRLLAYAWIRGKDLGYQLIAGGFGRVYVYDRPFRRLSAYRRAEASGRERGPSIWTCGRRQPPSPRGRCDPSYPTVCIPPPPPDLDCGEISYRTFTVLYNVPNPDPHKFDGDHDGVGCET